MRKSFLFVALAVMSTTAVHAQVPAAEREALIALHTSTDGAHWTNHSSWLLAAGTECSWFGVTCSGGHVVELVLPSNQLNGVLPIQLANLSSLSVLDLHSNQLIGHIPPELGYLSVLSDLNLGYNGLFGSIPSELQYMFELTILNLESNDLSGSIPSALGALSILQRLDLSHNELSGNVPAALGSLSALQYMDLSINQLDGSIPAELGDLSSLTFLSIGGTQVSGSIPPELGDLLNLVQLRLNSNQLSGEIPGALGSLPNLETLYLMDNQLTGSIPPELGDLSSLTSLWLSDNQLSGAIPPELGDLSSLSGFFAASNQLCGAIPPELGSLSSLGDLDLSSNRLTGNIPAELGDLSDLEDLDLSSNRLSGPIPPELGDLTEELARLFLDSNQLSGSVPAELRNLWMLVDEDGLDIRWNALHCAEASLINWLNDKQIGGNWQSTQTVAPENLVVGSVSDHTVWLSWGAVTYQSDPGGYEAFFAPSAGGPWVSAGQTSAKTELEIPVSGLEAGMSYDLAVASYTSPHPNNQNLVTSDLGPPAMQTTASVGCPTPTIDIVWGDPVTLSVSGTFDSYLWSTGETSAAINVDLLSAEYYWVTVTGPGPCEESAIVYVGPDIFDDGFESGDISEW